MGGLKNLTIINPPKDRAGVHITDAATDTLIEDCDIEGTIENSGKNTAIIGTKVRTLRREHPAMFWITIAGFVLGIPSALVAILQLLG